MTLPRRAFVDSHVHLWDVAANPWYSFPQPGPNDFGLGLKAPFPDRFLWPDYLETVSAVELRKFVHVTAVTQARDVEAETAWIDAIARQAGLPYAIVGTIDLEAPLGEIEALIAREQRHPAYRGFRLLGGADYGAEKTRAVLRLMGERGLVYDAVAHTGSIADAGRGLAAYPDLTVVLEHTGWPLAMDAGHVARWREELAVFAGLPNAFCKLSGLGMTVHRNDLDTFRRFFDPALELFGPARCMFASNFPVDLSYGEPDELFAIFEVVAQELDEAEAEMLYASTAERAYRI